MRCCARWSVRNAPINAITAGRPGSSGRWANSTACSCGASDVMTLPFPVVCLTGPTASGKSAASLALAARWPVEIIVMDSATIYRGMDIGTAKPSPAEQATVPHHLLDIRDPAEAYSAAEFRNDALALIADIVGRGRLPLICGGTLMYYKVLREGISELPEADPALRAR